MRASSPQTGTMRAIVIREPGGPEVLSLRRVPLPEPGAGEVRVRVHASGLNRADLLQRRGVYPAPPGWPPDIPGLEYAGIVDALGPPAGTTAESPDAEASTEPRVAVGDPVMGIVGGGGCAEAVVVNSDELIPVPEGTSLEEAAAIPEAFMTAFDALVLQAGVRAGETGLVHAVGSGVGTAALQLARAAGARVIGTSRTPEKLERARARGLEGAVVADADWPERVLARTEGLGVDVILDLVGGPYLSGNQRVLATRGRMIVVGVTGGVRAEIDLRLLMARRASIAGTVLRARPPEEKARLAHAFTERVVPVLGSGDVRPVVDDVYAPERVADAHRRIEANDSFGKLVLRWR
jgi:putative PIG3 family NAD(P)H quinone oxidoreductase